MTLSANTFPEENNIEDLTGFIRTSPEDPSATGVYRSPRKFSQQIVLVTNGGSTSAYFYDTTNQAWKYVALT